MRPTHAFIGLCLIVGIAAQRSSGDDVKDLFFGEALYHARQGVSRERGRIFGRRF